MLVSACLLGINCKYNGRNNRSLDVLELSKVIQLIPICPEQLGGLSTPREKAEVEGGKGEEVLEGKARVVNEKGREVTSCFVKGAWETLRIAQLLGIKEALLKERSPSCGTNFIYDGTFSGKLMEGRGVTAALLKKHGLVIRSEEELQEGGPYG